MISWTRQSRIHCRIEAIDRVIAVEAFIPNFTKVPLLHVVVGFSVVVCMEFIGKQMWHPV